MCVVLRGITTVILARLEPEGCLWDRYVERDHDIHVTRLSYENLPKSTPTSLSTHLSAMLHWYDYLDLFFMTLVPS